ncbi:hypothetical protein HUS67_13980 [Cobetia marina]|uniref:hypothetical protein n=1 Tax=Cobetia marina TaxID=28258 RepID=UPI001582F68C|nr:hypothetical protein [Cobetia marina]NUJ57419.1 hypothetical protein [Cobetia marina]
MIFEACFKNIKQNNYLQTSFTAGNAMRPRQRMRTLRTNRREGKGFFKRLSFSGHADDISAQPFSSLLDLVSLHLLALASFLLADIFPWPATHSAPPRMAGPNIDHHTAGS